MSAFQPERDLADLLALSEYADRLIAGDRDGTLAYRAPEISGWSAEHHVAHLALANELVLRNLHSMLRGSGMFLVQGGEPRDGVREMLITGRFPRGRAQAPRIVRPPDTVERALLLEWQASNHRAIEALLARAAEIQPGELKVPHQLLGPLDGPQWARFGAAHTRHHLEIALEVLRVIAPALPCPALPGP